MKCPRYPGVDEAEFERMEAARRFEAEERMNEPPDWLNGAPNYDKYPGLSAEQVLVLYNID